MEHTKQDVDAAAAGFLARRDHSRAELRAKLMKREFPADLVDDVLNDYVERGWLNDSGFASHQAEILARKGWGPLQIQNKLTQHGVGRDDARAATDALEVDWESAARARVEGRFRAGDEAKAYRHLVQRGFLQGVARKVAFSLDED
ncbi:MAG: regulatory protein RecX [bacterium]